MPDDVPQALAMIDRLLTKQVELYEGIPSLQAYIWENIEPIDTGDMLHDLAWNLEFYEPSESLRKQDEAFFDDSEALKKLSEVSLLIKARLTSS